MTDKRCAVCKKKITEEDESTTLSAGGREIATCCSGKCFGLLCELAPNMLAETEERKIMGCESACVQLCQSLLDAISAGIEGIGLGIGVFATTAGSVGGLGLPIVLLYKFLRRGATAEREGESVEVD